MKKMDIYRKQISLVILFLLSTHAEGQPNVGLASVLVKEGEMAEISCVTNAGSHSEYFWRKGESLHNSTEIAYFISGLPTDDSGRFKVTQNGTLILKKVTLDDEGKYICRVSSEESDCHEEIFVFVQAVLQDFQLTIEYCEPENSCVISTTSIEPTSLTCKATNASPSMKLKWFNGSREIKDNIEENSLTKGPSREISSTIKDVYKAPSTLTCQAVDFKTSNDEGMFAHVQFRTPASTADISLGWIVTAILFIVGFVILFLIVIVMRVWPKVRKGKDIETQNSAERESLLSKDKELRDKSEQISKLEKSLETVTGKLTNEEHQKTATTQQLNLESELLTHKDSLNKKDLEIQKLQSKLEHVEEQLTKIQSCEDDTDSMGSHLKPHESPIKKQSIDLAKKERIFRLHQMASKDRIRITCRMTTSSTSDDVVVTTKVKGGQPIVKAKYKVYAKEAKFHTVYPSSAKTEDLCLSIVDIVEIAIDGGKSCLIAHDASRRDHWTTMYGPDEGASDALVPYAIRTIFRKSKELRALDYKVDVKARFMDNSWITVEAATSTPPFSESGKKVDIANEQSAFELLKKGHGNIDHTDGATDHFLQFYIKTQIGQEESTGTLILATMKSVQMIQECFHSEEPKTQLTRNISEITSDVRSRSVLITHIHADRGNDIWYCLEMVNQIAKKNKK